MGLWVIRFGLVGFRVVGFRVIGFRVFGLLGFGTQILSKTTMGPTCSDSRNPPAKYHSGP